MAAQGRHERQCGTSVWWGLTVGCAQSISKVRGFTTVIARRHIVVGGVCIGVAMDTVTAMGQWHMVHARLLPRCDCRPHDRGAPVGTRGTRVLTNDRAMCHVVRMYDADAACIEGREAAHCSACQLGLAGSKFEPLQVDAYACAAPLVMPFKTGVAVRVSV
jgi:hypothetical protein